MKKDLIQLIKVVVLALFLSIGVSFVFAAWQDPTANPPGDNAEAPLNVSATGQIKSGGLTLNSPGAAAGGYSQVGNSGDGVGLFRRLSIWGNIWADKYCDRSGGNCLFPSDTNNPGYVKRIIAGTNITISPASGVGEVTINSSGGGGGVDEKVKVSANDTTARYLRPKLVAGTGISITELNDASDEQLEISATGGGGSDDKTVKVNSNDPTPQFLRPSLLPGRGITLTVTADNNQLTIDGGYHRIQDEGNARAQQATLNFTGAGVSCTNDATNNRTNCDVSGGGGGGKSNLYVKRVVGQYVKVFCNSGDVATGGGADNGVTGGKDTYYSYPIDAAGNMAADGGQAAGWHCGTELTGRCYVICMR